MSYQIRPPVTSHFCTMIALQVDGLARFALNPG